MSITAPNTEHAPPGAILALARRAAVPATVLALAIGARLSWSPNEGAVSAALERQIVMRGVSRDSDASRPRPLAA